MTIYSQRNLIWTEVGTRFYYTNNKGNDRYDDPGVLVWEGNWDERVDWATDVRRRYCY